MFISLYIRNMLSESHKWNLTDSVYNWEYVKYLTYSCVDCDMEVI